MEGPSLFLAAQQLRDFKGKKIKVVSGNTTIGKEQLLHKEVKDIFSWGKHLVFQFDTIAFRVHFLLFGTFEATVNGESVTGDYKRTREPRLALSFVNGEIKMFNCSIKVFETADLKSTYDFSIDIMSPQWDSANAVENIRAHPQEEIADVLLDQEIFAGVGNIIKNEVLSLVHINPRALANSLSFTQLVELVSQTHAFSKQFYAWRKEFVLMKNLQIQL
jgi:endonuclease VIII